MIIYSDYKSRNEIIPGKYVLFLDDSRFPRDVATWIDLPPHNWVIVRNYNEFVDCIIKYNCPMVCSFDHDLFPEHYQAFAETLDERLVGGKQIHYNNFTEKTGYHCAVFLANYCLDKKVELPLYYVHSLNGVGCANIFSVMESARKIMNET